MTVCPQEVKAMAASYPRPVNLQERNHQQICIAAYLQALTPDGVAAIGQAYAEVYP